MTANIEVTSKPAVNIKVFGVTGGSGSGGVSDHGALTGLADDDHLQYQRSKSVFTSTSPYTITDESIVVTYGSAVTLPSASANAGRVILIGSSNVAVTVAPSGTDSLWDNVGSPYVVPPMNGVSWVSLEISGAWGWGIYQRNGNAFDTPPWYGLAVTQGKMLRMGASSPEWASIQASDLGTGTADASHFLAGDLTWQDAVPLDVAVKNTSASTIAKGVPVYATGTVGVTSVIQIAPANSASSATMSAIGLTTTSLSVNATGYVRVIGVLSGLNTSSYAVNGAAYVASGGGLTPTRPTGTTTLVQNIGRATRINASTGEILILGPGRTNDVPNLIDTNFLASSGTASRSTFLRGDQSWATPLGVANDTVWDSAGDLAVGTGADTAARLAKGTQTQALVVGASTLEWDTNHFNGGNIVTATVTGAIAETVPGGAGHGATTGGGTGVVHLHGIYLPKGVTITTITFVSGATAAVTPTNQWFALCNSSRTVLRVTANDTTTAWNSSTAKPLNLTSTYTTTYSGLYYLACCVTASTVPSFRGANAGTATGVAQQSFLSTTGQTTPVAEGTTFIASTGRLSQALGIVS